MGEKVFAVITIARQVEGDYVFIKTEKAFRSAKKADDLMMKLKKDAVVMGGKIKPVKISTPQGDAKCFLEIGAFELELEDD